MTVALLVFLTAVFWAAPAMARPTLPFGVRVPAARATDPAVITARRRYGKAVLTCGALAVVGAVALAAAPTLAVTVLAAVDCALGYLAHRVVAAAKGRGDWYAGVRQGVVADTSFRTDPVRPQWTLLLPAVVLFVATIATGVWRYPELPTTLPTPNGMGVDAGQRSATTVPFAFATATGQLLLVLLVALLAIAIPRSRPEVDAEQPDASAARYRIYLRGTLRLLFATAACGNASLLVAALQVWEILEPSPAVTIAGYLPLAAALLAWLVFALRAGDAGHRLPANEEHEESGRVQRDDDRHWHLAGMVYLNRGDPALLVHRRVGGYWTLNLGNPISWAILAAIAAVAILAGTGVIELPERG